MSAVENAVLQVAARFLTPDPATAQALVTKLKPEHLTTILEIQRLIKSQDHVERMARLKAASETE